MSSLSLIELSMLFDAPFNDEALRLPLFAANAAPAAICCFLDFAGINFSPESAGASWLVASASLNSPAGGGVLDFLRHMEMALHDR